MVIRHLDMPGSNLLLSCSTFLPKLQQEPRSNRNTN
jgi:hypothetical protein